MVQIIEDLRMSGHWQRKWIYCCGLVPPPWPGMMFRQMHMLPITSSHLAYPEALWDPLPVSILSPTLTTFRPPTIPPPSTFCPLLRGWKSATPIIISSHSILQPLPQIMAVFPIKSKHSSFPLLATAPASSTPCAMLPTPTRFLLRLYFQLRLSRSMDTWFDMILLPSQIYHFSPIKWINWRG